MPRRRSAARRSATEWGVRGLLALAAALLGQAAVTRSIAAAVQAGDPARAHRLAPGDGQLAGLYARTLADVDASAADRARADRLARQALRQDPTVVPAVSTLGVDAQIRGDAGRARRLFGYAGLLSRRDLQTQIWAIEDAVGRGDVPGALRHYDIALRTSAAAPDLLFPILVSAMANPPVRAALIRTLAGRPLWGPTFVDYAAGNAPDPRIAASLLAELERSGTAVSERARAAAIAALIGGGFVDRAWAYYATVRPGADRRASRDARFAADPASPSPFDWTALGDAGAAASIQRGVAEFSAPASVGGTVLRQLQLLPAGDYALEGHAAPLDQPAGSLPYWTLTCLDGRELGRVALPGAARADGRFGGRFAVPAGCAAQYLSLVLLPSDAAAGISGQIDRVRLRPAR